MSRRDRRKTLAPIGLESLEGRRVLSTATGVAHPIVAELITLAPKLVIHGSVHGTVAHPAGIPDTGASANFKGAGKVHGLGSAKVTGTIHGTGFIGTGHVQGTMTLATGKGSVTLQFTGPTVGGNTAPSSGTYSYSVVKGTAAFRHDYGSGTVNLKLGPETFTMTLSSAPVAV